MSVCVTHKLSMQHTAMPQGASVVYVLEMGTVVSLGLNDWSVQTDINVCCMM